MDVQTDTTIVRPFFSNCEINIDSGVSFVLSADSTLSTINSMGTTVLAGDFYCFESIQVSSTGYFNATTVSVSNLQLNGNAQGEERFLTCF